MRLQVAQNGADIALMNATTGHLPRERSHILLRDLRADESAPAAFRPPGIKAMLELFCFVDDIPRYFRI